MNDFENNSADLSNESKNLSKPNEATNIQPNDPFENFNRPTERLDQINPQNTWQYQQQQHTPPMSVLPPPPPPPFQNQQNYQQPQFPPQYYPQMNPYPPLQRDSKSGMAIASMILGIVSVVLFCIPILPIITGIVGIILGIIGLKSSGKGMAIAGIITSALGVLFWIVFVAIAFIAGFMEGFSTL